MTAVKTYIYSLCALLIICSLIYEIVPGGEIKKTLKFVMGIIIAVTVISPLFSVSIEDYGDFFEANVYGKSEFISGNNELYGVIVRQTKEKTERSMSEKLGKNVKINLNEKMIITGVEVENVTEQDKIVISQVYGIEREKIR